MLIERSASRSFGSQILVFHFPGVVQGVKGGVADQEPERPFRHLAGQLALSVVVPYCIAIGRAMRFQSLASQHRTVRGEHTDHLRPILLRGERMTDDTVPITPSPARTLLHLSRHPPAHLSEKRPAR